MFEGLLVEKKQAVAYNHQDEPSEAENKNN
jgi:hypothetical protein